MTIYIKTVKVFQKENVHRVVENSQIRKCHLRVMIRRIKKCCSTILRKVIQSRFK